MNLKNYLKKNKLDFLYSEINSEGFVCVAKLKSNEDNVVLLDFIDATKNNNVFKLDNKTDEFYENILNRMELFSMNS